MAFTKVVGAGIHTESNINSHNINSTGIVTAIGLDVSGNATIGGVLTYEDVTSIDSVGLITARNGIQVTSGNIGIGTNSPQEELHILNTNPSIRLHHDNGNNIFSQILQNGPNLKIRLRNGSSNGGMHVQGNTGTDVTTFVRVTNSGNVGIGTDIPSYKLDVRADHFTKAVFKGTGSNSNNIPFYIMSGNSATQIGNHPTAQEETIIFNSSSNYLAFETADTERLRITGVGNVGIGTDNPHQKLHISATNPIIKFTDIDDNQSSMIRGASGHLYLDTDNTNRDIIFRGGDSSTYEVARITGDGNVGIGTQSPQAKLEVYTDDTLIGGIVQIIQDGTGDASIDFQLKGTREYTLGIDNSDSDKFKLSGSAGLGSNDLLTVTSSGRLGLGLVSPQAVMHVEGGSEGNLLQLSNTHTGATTSDGFVMGINSSLTYLYNRENKHLTFGTNNTERLRIDSGGRLLVNRINNDAPGGSASKLQIRDTTYTASIAVVRNDPGGGGPSLIFGKSRNATESDNTLVQNGDTLGQISFFGADGSDMNSTGAIIAAQVDGTPGSNDMPGRLVFKTTADGSASSTERLRITSTGEVLINETSARSYVDGAGNTQTPKLQVEADDNTSSAISLTYNSGGGSAGRRASFMFARTADGSAVSNNSVLGEVLFMGEGNSTLEKAASIRAEVDGAPGTNDMPGRLIFSTSADGSDSPTERLRITSSGNVGINSESPSATLEIKDIGSTGPCVLIRGATSSEGDVTVPDGETFNFGHWNYSSSAFTERLRIDSSGKIGIGQNNPATTLEIKSDANAQTTATIPTLRITNDDGSASANDITGSVEFFTEDSSDPNHISGFMRNISETNAGVNFSLVFGTKSSNIAGDATEKLRIQSNGKLLFGNHQNDRGAELQYEGSEHAGIGIHRNTNSHGAPALQFSASRGTSAGSNTIVQSGDYLGMISFKGTDGSDLANGAFITAIVDGTPGNNDMPGRLGFWTSPDGSQTPVERLRITSGGDVLLNDTTNSIYNDTSGAGFNFKSHGQLVLKKQASSVGDPLVWLNDTGQTTNKTIVLAQDGAEKGFVGLTGTSLSLGAGGSERLRITSAGAIKLNDNNIEPTGPGGNITTAYDNAGWEKIVFDASYNQNPIGPNKIILQNDSNGGGWYAGFGIATNELSIYSGGNTVFYRGFNNASAINESLRIDSGGRVTKPDQPRALVEIYSTTTLSTGKVTNWASPMYNVGGLWDTTNKRFVAPIAGLYLVGGNFRLGAPGKIRVVRFMLNVYNTSGSKIAAYGGGVGGGNNYDGQSSGYDHPYVSFTNAAYLNANEYLELHLEEVGTENTSYIQQSNNQSHMWCVLLQ